MLLSIKQKHRKERSKRLGRRFGLYQRIVDQFKDQTDLKPNVQRSIEKLRKILQNFPEAAKDLSMESLKKKDRLIRVKISVLESRLNITLLNDEKNEMRTDEKKVGCSNSSTEF